MRRSRGDSTKQRSTLVSPMDDSRWSRARKERMVSRGLERTWDKRVDTWHDNVTTSDAFEGVREELISRAQPRPTDACVDLGAGTGFLTLPLARMAASVFAVDISSRMIAELDRLAGVHGLGNVDSMAGDLMSIELPEASVDLIVSNYTLHHLPHHEKRILVGRARGWLRPGGRIVIADLMIGRNLSAENRGILTSKAKRLVAKGPGGIWRIVKALTKYGLQVGEERPASPQFWREALTHAGFVGVDHARVVNEAGVVWGMVPQTRGG
ncbi:MAG: methyltransferase domain-containing protein [Streptosporangiales bacterium]|nr:methyltransferase domain-containing protein [Streptosporangiales bacterium]